MRIIERRPDERRAQSPHRDLGVLQPIVAWVALVVSGPVLAVIALALRCQQGPPVFFRQPRLGREGEPFEMWKFRTMTDERDVDGGLLADADRLTPFGRWLRSTSLDELPELWNVAHRDMNLVGPRPLPVAYRDRFTKTEARRMEVRPGLTGWAQINGRNGAEWDDRLAMDVWYVENRSLWLDLRILGRTAGMVLGRKGIAAEGSATMNELRRPETGNLRDR